MLAQLRALTRGWIARILLGFIALAMAITLFQGDFVSGLQSMFNPSGVASVANQAITPQQLNREFDLYLRSQQRQGQTISRPDAITANVHLRILDSMIQRRAMHAYAERLGVHASNTLAAEMIRNIPAAKNELTGRFDRAAYQGFLRDVGYSAGEFESEVRGDLAASSVIQALTAGLRAPSSYGALILAYQSERRTVSVAEATSARLGQIPAPTPAQLQAFYEDNRAAFAVPEFRTVTVIVARAADFAARVEVPEARIRDEFEARRASLAEPERRSFVQLSAPDEAKARDAAQRLSRGEAPDAVARALGLQAVRQENRAQTDIADAAVRQAVFGLAAGAPASAIPARLSPWAVVRLESITAASAPNFEHERERIRQEIAEHEAATLMDAAIEAFESARDAGGNLAQAAAAQGLAVITIPAISAEGRRPDGQPEDAIVDMPEVVATAFETQEGEATDFMPVGDGVDVIVQVDSIIPASTRPLESVRDQLIAGWTTRERSRLMNELANQVIAAVRGGQSFAAAVSAARINIVARSQQLDRRTAAQIPDQQFVGAVFGTDVGAVGSVIRPDGGAMLLVHVEGVQRADLAQNREIAEQLRQEAQQQLGRSLVEAIEASAVDAARVRRNDARIAQLFAPADATQSTQQP
jgi:peptidyl-prolyl cis-trans isomerase D